MEPKEKRIKVAVYLEADQKRRLDALSKIARVKWSEYVREGVDMVLKKHERRKP